MEFDRPTPPESAPKPSVSSRNWANVVRPELRAALGVSVLSALIVSLPAALRTARAEGSPAGGWVVGAAVLLPLAILVIGLSSAAARGFRLVFGKTEEGRAQINGTVVTTLVLWAGLVSPVLLILGSMLKSGTNHRGLGGGTFGVLSLIVLALALVTAHRLVRMSQGWVDRGVSPSRIAIAVSAIAIVPVALLSLPLLSSAPESSGSDGRWVAAVLIDGVLFLVATSALSNLEFGQVFKSVMRNAGPPVAAGVFVAGTAWLMLSPELGQAVRRGGGLAASMMSVLEGWTDRDLDGRGAHFGGGDCDDGDRLVHPGADDPFGDGVDQNCDGVDGVASRGEAEAGASAEVRPEAAPAPVEVASSASAVPSASAQASPVMERPNILFISVDSLRADHVGLYGYEPKTTPILDALGARSIVFERAYANAPDTQRAMMPLFANDVFAKIPKDRREWPTLKDEAVTLAETLKERGYRTGFVGAFQWYSRERGFAQGFDDFITVYQEEHPERGVTGPLVVRDGRSFLKRMEKSDEPFFLWLQFFDPHGEWKSHDGLSFGKGKKGAYDGEVAFTDQQIGDVLKTLAEGPKAKSTVVVIAGTYGEPLGERAAKGRDAFEEQVRVPLVISIPSVAPKRVTEPVSLGDLPGTLVELAGAQSLASLRPHWEGEPPADAPLYLDGERKKAVIVWPLKLIRVERKGKDQTRLFDLVADPEEKKDLSESRGDDVRKLSGLLDQRFVRRAPP